MCDEALKDAKPSLRWAWSETKVFSRREKGFTLTLHELAPVHESMNSKTKNERKKKKRNLYLHLILSFSLSLATFPDINHRRLKLYITPQNINKTEKCKKQNKN